MINTVKNYKTYFPKSKKFNGKTYYYYGRTVHKSNANEIAYLAKKRYGLARITFERMKPFRYKGMTFDGCFYVWYLWT